MSAILHVKNPLFQKIFDIVISGRVVRRSDNNIKKVRRKVWYGKRSVCHGVVLGVKLFVVLLGTQIVLSLRLNLILF